MKSMFIAMLGEKGKELEGIEEVEEMFVGIKRGFEKAIKEAEEEGMKKGIEEGMKKGIEEGMKKGIKEGKEKGHLEARKEDILELLRLRFGEVPNEVEDKIKKTSDIDRLNEIFKMAATVKSMDEFEEFLNRK